MLAENLSVKFARSPPFEAIAKATQLGATDQLEDVSSYYSLASAMPKQNVMFWHVTAHVTQAQVVLATL